MDLDNEDYGKPVAEYFGVSGNGPKVSRYLFLFLFLLWDSELHIYKNLES